MKTAYILIVSVLPCFISPFSNLFDNASIDYSSAKTKIINKKSGVDFNFCLLNKNGQTSSVFSENENFSFFLTIQNNSGDSLYFDNSFILDENTGFCIVYSQDNKQVGRPFTLAGAQIVSSSEHPFYGVKSIYKLKIPWTDSRPLWTEMHCNLKGNNNPKLPKGKYYTIFKHRFCFDRTSSQPSLCLDNVDVRIDFEVK